MAEVLHSQVDVPVRRATYADAAGIAETVNKAFRVESFFVDGDRVTIAEIHELWRNGEFLVLDHASDVLAGSVYVRCRGRRGYFGLLAVQPELQGMGIGRRLVCVAEAMCEAQGCDVMELQVVNLRQELPPWYRSLGYRHAGTAPFPEQAALKHPCHFIKMTKPLC